MSSEITDAVDNDTNFGKKIMFKNYLFQVSTFFILLVPKFFIDTLLLIFRRRYVDGARGDNGPPLRDDRVRVQSDNEPVPDRLRQPRRGESRGGDGRREEPPAGPRGFRLANGAANQRRDEEPREVTILPNRARSSLILRRPLTLEKKYPLGERKKKKQNKTK